MGCETRRSEGRARPLLAVLHQQGADLEAGRTAGQQVALEVVEGEPAVDDVLDDEDVAVGQVDVEVLHDAHHPRRPGGAAVGGDRHEVDLDRQRDGPGQVAHEHEGALQHPDEQRRSVGVVVGDLPAELDDPGLEVAARTPPMRRPRRGPPTAGPSTVTSHPPRRPRPDCTGVSSGAGSVPDPASDGPGRDGPVTRDSRPTDRTTRRPPGTSVARAPAGPRPAPARRRRAVAGGDRLPVSQAPDAPPGRRRRGRRPGPGRPRGRPARPARRGGRRRRPARSAWRARTGTTSRPAMAEHRGSSSWRTRLRTNRGSSFEGSWTGRRPSRRQSASVSDRRRSSRGWAGPARMAASPCDAGAPQQVGQHRLGLVVGRVAGGGARAEDPVSGRPGPRLEVRAVRDGHPHGAERRPEPFGGRAPPPRPRPPSRPGARGPRGRR